MALSAHQVHLFKAANKAAPHCSWNLANWKSLLICSAHTRCVRFGASRSHGIRRDGAVAWLAHRRGHVPVFAYARAHHRRHKIRVRGRGFCERKEIHCGCSLACVVASRCRSRRTHTFANTWPEWHNTRCSPIVIHNMVRAKDCSSIQSSPLDKKRDIYVAECRCKRDTLKIIHSDNSGAVAV